VTTAEINSQRENYLETVPKRCADPMRRVEAHLAAIGKRARKFPDAGAGELEFEFAREAAIQLCLMASRLHDLSLWQVVQAPREERHDPDETNWKAIMAESLCGLRNHQCDFTEIEDAIDEFEECIDKLNDDFLNSRMPRKKLSPSLSIERYTCAAMLPRILKLLREQKWRQDN
jgi:hypothetical protein